MVRGPMAARAHRPRDLDKDGAVEPKDLPKLCKALGETWSYEQVMEAFRALKPANAAQVSTREFVKVQPGVCARC